MSYVVNIWKENILNTASPESYEEAEKILYFLNQKCSAGFRLNNDIYSDLIKELAVDFPVDDREEGDYHRFWHDGSLLDSEFEAVTAFALSSKLSHNELTTAYTIILKHNFIILDSQGGCALLPDGRYLISNQLSIKKPSPQPLLLASINKLVTRFLGAK
jgi:hypothetical protein